MDDHGEFDSVSWQREDATQAESSAPFHSTLPDRSASGRRSDSISSEPQAGEQADPVDLAGIGRDGILEITVDTPLKENDGTKDAYVSYLVTTHVRLSWPAERHPADFFCRQTSSPSKKAISASDVDLPILSSSARLCTETIKHARYLHCRRRTTWHM